jgi:putative aldouronate transport system substrate-binding protein
MEPFPEVIYTTQETEELSILATDITNYILQAQAKWVTQGGIESEWAGYIRQLEAMGLDRFVQIKIDAYNRFKGR